MMRKAKLGNGLSRHFQESIWLYVVSLLCLFTGIVLGIYTVKYMGDMERQDLVSYFLGFKSNIKSIEINNTAILIKSIKSNLPMIIIIWLVGITVIGIPIVLIIDIIKGFSFGFTLTFIIYSMGYKGIWFILLSIIPQNIIYLPCIIVASVLSMRLSMMKLKDRVNKQMNYNKNYVLDYSITFLILVLITILGCLYQAYITPKAIQTVAFISGSVVA